MEVSQRAVAHALQVEFPTVVAAAANSPILSMGEGGLQAVLDMAARTDDKSLNPKAARILSKVVAAMWEVHRVWKILLSTTAWVPGYNEKPVTQKRSSHACLIIEILA
jgi:hypothetical protein